MYLGAIPANISAWIEQNVEQTHPETIIEFGDGTISSFNWSGEINENTINNAGLKISSSEWLDIVDIKIGTNATSIDEMVFEDCTTLTSITIPNNVTTIGEYAFSSCTNLTNIAIYNNAININQAAFQLSKTDSEQAVEVTFTNQDTSTIEQWFENNCFGFDWATNHGINVTCTDGVVHAKYDNYYGWTVTVNPTNQ